MSNIALIENLNLTFQGGFTVFTGETGAGKSILLDALDALLGGFSGSNSKRLIRKGTSNAHIEASFLISHSIQLWLNDNDFIIDDSELIISREFICKAQKVTSRFRLNGVLVNRDQITSLRPYLIDLTAQGQTQLLHKESQQLFCLDSFGGENLSKDLKLVNEAWNKWYEAFHRLSQLRSDLEHKQNKYEEQKSALLDLEAANLTNKSEEVYLLKEQDRLAHSVRLQKGTINMIENINEGSSEKPSAVSLLEEALHELNAMVQLDKSLEDSYQNFLDILSNLNDLTQGLNQYLSLLDSDPTRLEQLQERISYLKRLQIRYNLDLSSLIDHRENLRSSLAANDLLDNQLDKLKLNEERLLKERDEFNNKLTQTRITTAKQLQTSLTNYLVPMGLKHVRFDIEITPSDPSRKGSDSIRFLFSANPDQPLRPLVDIASGGEMSRFLLALKTTLSAVSGSSTILFDEIDSGVSGRVSSAIAELLKKLSLDRQVLCVTHQPLVAAHADHHFRVQKVLEQGVTMVHVSSLLSIQERKDELVELAGGDFVDASVYVSSLLSKKAA